MVLAEVDAPSKSEAPRRRAPVGLVGLAILVALVAAYLSDCIPSACIPGLGSGQPAGTPTPTATPEPVDPVEAPSNPSQPPRLGIIVQGDRCQYDQAAAAPCAEVCAALPRTHADTVVVEVEATEGRHGSVEALRKCLVQAGFANVRVHAE